jgi:uncharacterized protein (DUF2345 family)
VTAGDSISLTAGESISLTVGDAQLIMKKDGSVTLYGSKIEVFGTEHIHLGSKLIDLDDVIETFKNYDEQVKLEHDSIAGLPYYIEASNGRVFSGRVDESGKLPRIYTQHEEEYDVYWGDEALAQMNEG